MAKITGGRGQQGHLRDGRRPSSGQEEAGLGGYGALYWGKFWQQGLLKGQQPVSEQHPQFRSKRVTIRLGMDS